MTLEKPLNLSEPLLAHPFNGTITCASQGPCTDRVSSVPSTEPDPRQARVPSLTGIYHVPSVCQAAGQPEGDSEDVSARLQSDVERPLCPGCAGAGYQQALPLWGQWVF